MRRRLKRMARREDPIRRFVHLPGVKWVRAATVVAYIDAPWRFASRQRRWKYCGIGLERGPSGAKRRRVRLAHRANRVLKYVLLGAARSAVLRANNPFASQSQQWLGKGNSPAVALRNTARSLTATLWAMWKTGRTYDPNRVARSPTPSIIVSRPANGRT